MNILRFLICNSRMSGKQLMLARHYTTWDDFHQCYSYICADKAEYDKMCREVVGKQQKRFWGEVEVFNTETKKRSKVTEVIGVILAVEQAPPALPAADSLSQTPGDSQSGGEQSPAESMGTFSEPSQAPVIDIAADLAANTTPADDVEAGQEQPQAVSEELPPEDAPPASTSPASAAKAIAKDLESRGTTAEQEWQKSLEKAAKRKAGRPAKAK